MKVQVCLAALLCLVAVAFAADFGEECTSADDCPTNGNMMCAKRDGCTTKGCFCMSGYSQYSSTSCLKDRNLGQSCTQDSQCTAETSNSECSSSECACTNGYEKDGDDCEGAIALGDDGCDSDNFCKAGSCTSGTCECPSSQKEDGNECRNAEYGESCAGDLTCGSTLSCNSDDECECGSGYKRADGECRYATEGESCDGVTCNAAYSLTCNSDDTCECSAGSSYSQYTYYTSSAEVTGCMHDDATRGASRGTVCSEVTTSSGVWCKDDNYCQSCPGESSTRCLSGAMGVVASTGLMIVVATITSYLAL